MNTLCFALSLLLRSVCSVPEGPEMQCLEVGQNIFLMCPDTVFNESVLVTWKINRTSGEQCSAAVRFDQNQSQLNSTCKSRVTVQIEGDRAVLYISVLHQSDEGSYTCEHVYHGGMNTTHFNICTMGSNRHNPSENSHVIPVICIASAAVLIVISLILRKRLTDRCRTQRQSAESSSEQELNDVEPYSMFIQKSIGLYSTRTFVNT